MMIEGIQGDIPRRRSSEVGDALRGHDHVNLEAIIKYGWRYTRRP